MTSKTIRKQMLIAEVIILADMLNQLDSLSELPEHRKRLHDRVLKEHEARTRELVRLCNSLVGAS